MGGINSRHVNWKPAPLPRKMARKPKSGLYYALSVLGGTCIAGIIIWGFWGVIVLTFWR